MAGVPSDYTIVGTVLAIAVAIILLSGLALYISFRVRETLRDERGRGARAAKVAFLIGLLFLSGGVFYFFASGFNASTGSASTTQSSTQQSVSSTSSLQSTSNPPTTSTTSSSASSSSTVSSLTTTSTTSLSTISSSTTTTTSTSPSSGGSVSMSVQCPTSGGSVTAGGTFNCTITIYNVGSSTYQGATLVSSGDFSQFSFQSCSETVNGSPGSCTVASSTEISVGALSPGTTVLTLGVIAPSTAGQKNCILTLAAPGLGQTVTATFTVQVTNRP